MNANAKTKWLEALRSGSFTQTKGALQKCAGGNCCLGVLANIMEVPHRGRPDHERMFFEFSKQEINSDRIPDGFCGVKKDEIFKLISLNDHEGYDFSMIADYIEKEL